MDVALFEIEGLIRCFWEFPSLNIEANTMYGHTCTRIHTHVYTYTTIPKLHASPTLKYKRSLSIASGNAAGPRAILSELNSNSIDRLKYRSFRAGTWAFYVRPFVLYTMYYFTFAHAHPYTVGPVRVDVR